jgi:UDP-N-acetylglucosamine--N-acetylmuramyl-(pentapeptide) pyrophosphoryl-undecaprenol N-acetylglucosamine transferase
VPLAIAGAHQADNAVALVAAGAARLVAADGAPSDLALLLSGLLARPAQLVDMGAAARRLARPDAAQRLARCVIDLAEAA